MGSTPYRCFDRLLLNGLIQPFQQPERVLGFFNTYRDGKWVTHRASDGNRRPVPVLGQESWEKWGAPIVEAPEEQRRDDFVLKYMKDAETDHVAVILKAREPARILVAIGGNDNQSPHLEFKQRWINQYNFYLNDKHWGPMFVRMCPYFPFSARTRPYRFSCHLWPVSDYLCSMPAVETFPLRDYDSIAMYDAVCRKRFGRTYDLESIVQEFSELREPDRPLTARHLFALFNPEQTHFGHFWRPVCELEETLNPRGIPRPAAGRGKAVAARNGGGRLRIARQPGSRFRASALHASGGLRGIQPCHS